MSEMFIYSISDSVENRVRYVGMTNNPKQRFSAHAMTIRTGRSKAPKILALCKWFKTHNATPVFSILEKVDGREAAGDAEKRWIKAFPGCLANSHNTRLIDAELAFLPERSMSGRQR